MARLGDTVAVAETAHDEDRCTAAEKEEEDFAEEELQLKQAIDCRKARWSPELELSHTWMLVYKETALRCTAVRPQSTKWWKQCSWFL